VGEGAKRPEARYHPDRAGVDAAGRRGEGHAPCDYNGLLLTSGLPSTVLLARHSLVALGQVSRGHERTVRQTTMTEGVCDARLRWRQGGGVAC